MSSLKRHEGWLLLDHRASPGIPADIARKIGLPPEAVAGGKLFESATLSCKHCGGAWSKNPYRIRRREYCRPCDHYICDDCGREAAQPGYVHQCKEQKLDAVLAQSLIIP
jgi:hypothetical protein